MWVKMIGRWEEEGKFCGKTSLGTLPLDRCPSLIGDTGKAVHQGGAMGKTQNGCLRPCTGQNLRAQSFSFAKNQGSRLCVTHPTSTLPMALCSDNTGATEAWPHLCLWKRIADLSENRLVLHQPCKILRNHSQKSPH